MIRYLLLIIAPCLISNNVAAQDRLFCNLHPVALQEALEKCPQKHPANVSCEQLGDCAKHANALALELQRGPQQFGQSILALQEELVSLETELKNKPYHAQLQASVNDNKQQLSERLAIVKWLESPRG